METTLVTRMMLHLRKVACSGPGQSDATFFAESVMSTRIVWARLEPQGGTSRTVRSRVASLGVIEDREEEGGETIALRTFSDRVELDRRL